MVTLVAAVLVRLLRPFETVFGICEEDSCSDGDQDMFFANTTVGGVEAGRILPALKVYLSLKTTVNCVNPLLIWWSQSSSLNSLGVGTG